MPMNENVCVLYKELWREVSCQCVKELCLQGKRLLRKYLIRFVIATPKSKALKTYLFMGMFDKDYASATSAPERFAVLEISYRDKTMNKCKVLQINISLLMI